MKTFVLFDNDDQPVAVRLAEDKAIAAATDLVRLTSGPDADLTGMKSTIARPSDSRIELEYTLDGIPYDRVTVLIFDTEAAPLQF